MTRAPRRAGLSLVEVLVALALWALFATAVATFLAAAHDATDAARRLEAATAARTALRHQGDAALAALPLCPPGTPAARPCRRSDVRCDFAAPHAPCDGGTLHRIQIAGLAPDVANGDAEAGAEIDVWRYRP